MTEAPASAAPPEKRHNWRKTLALAAAALVLLAWGGHWVYQRYTHIYIDDARIDGNIITLSSRASASSRPSS